MNILCAIQWWLWHLKTENYVHIFKYCLYQRLKELTMKVIIVLVTHEPTSAENGNWSSAGTRATGCCLWMSDSVTLTVSF